MKKFFLAFAAMLMAFSVSAAELNVYASGLKAGEVKDGKVEISYLLNATATALEVQLIGADNAVAKAFPLTGDDLAKGAHKVTVDLADVAAGTYTWAIKASAEAHTDFAKVWESETILNRLHATVDASPESPYMGRIYAENRAGSGKGSLYAWNPDFTVLQENFMAGQTKWQSVGRPSVDAEGYVWLADYGDAHGGVWIMDPATLEATAFFQGTQNEDNGIWTNADGVEMGSSSSGCSVYGAGANTKLFMVNEDAGTSLVKNGYCVYNVGQADGTIARTWSAAPSQIVAVSDNAGGNFSIAGTSHGAWLCQNRAEPNDAAGARSLFFYDNAGQQQFLSTNDDAITGSNGGGMAVAATEDKLAIIGTANTIQIYDVAWTGDVPTLTLNTSYDCGYPAIGTLAFDYAGNLIAAAGATYGTNMRVVVFATPSDNVCTTPAPKVNTITVEAAAQVEPITLYCKMEHGWWYSDGAAVACYAFGNGENGAFPGVRMAKVEGEENLWTATIDGKYTKVIFARTSGSGDVANWGAQTADLDIPTDGKNLYTITSAEPVWDGGSGNKVAGEWSVYTPAEKPAETALATIVFKSVAEGGDGSAAKTEIADLIESGAEYVSALTAENIYQGKVGYGIKGGAGKKAGKLVLTLAEPIQATKLVLNAAAWQGTGAADATTLTINGTEYVLTPDFADYTLDVNGELSEITITSTTTSKARWYAKSLTIYGEGAAEGPQPTELWLTPGWGEITAGGEMFMITANFDVELTEEQLAENLKWTANKEGVTFMGVNPVYVSVAADVAAGQLEITATYGEAEMTGYYSIIAGGPQGISISPFNNLEIEAGQTLQLTAELYPETATDAILWTSSDETLATVSTTGLVTSLSPEKDTTVTITATVENYPEIYASVTVTLLAAEVAEGIVYDLDGGKVLPASNDELYALLKSYYPTYAEVHRADQVIAAAATFFQANTDKLMTDATSEYKWLGDYIIEKAGSTPADNTAWRFTLKGLLNCDAAGAHWAQVGGWDVNGQPAAWQAACADVTFTLPTSIENLGNNSEGVSTWNFLLPSAVKEGYDFKGWKDAAGNVVTEIPAGTTTGKYTAQWEVKQETGLENAAIENSNVRKVFENGNVYILRDGVRYTITGTVVE